MEKEKALTIIFDIYLLRYVVKNEWYELTDFVREKLREEGYKLSYDDKNEDIIVMTNKGSMYSMKDQIK